MYNVTVIWAAPDPCSKRGRVLFPGKVEDLPQPVLFSVKQNMISDLLQIQVQCDNNEVLTPELISSVADSVSEGEQSGGVHRQSSG